MCTYTCCSARSLKQLTGVSNIYAELRAVADQMKGSKEPGVLAMVITLLTVIIRIIVMIVTIVIVVIMIVNDDIMYMC